MAPVLLSFDELNKYEQVRQPHGTSEEEILVHPDSVRSEFTCIICLDILTKTMTSQHCVHRFCYDCITTSLRLGNKECPTCRAKLSSKRDLRADLVFDSLISTLFPQDIHSMADRRSSKLTESILGLSLAPLPNQINEKNQKTIKLLKENKSSFTAAGEIKELTKIKEQKNSNRKKEKIPGSEKELNHTEKKEHDAINSNDDVDYNNKSNNTPNSQNKDTRKTPLRKSLRHTASDITQESKEFRQNDHKSIKKKNRNTKRR